jgi:methionyl-tRNA formyltransferase
MKSNEQHGRYHVTFLLDNSNNWIEPFLLDSGVLDIDSRYICSISYSHEQVVGQQIVFVLGYTKILSPRFLSRNHLNLVVHESDLPYGKGFSPVQWQILEGKRLIPVCLIEAVERVDAGDIVLRGKIELDGYELHDEIRAKQARESFRLIREFLACYPTYRRQSQTGEERAFPRRTAKDGELDPDKTIREQFNLLRTGNNEQWPSYFRLGEQKYILKIFKG